MSEITRNPPPFCTYPNAQDQSLATHQPANISGIQLLNALWRSPDFHHQIGTLDRRTKQFKNLPVNGVADAMAQALQLSSEGNDVYFACAEYLTPNNRKSANASGACAFWMDLDCGENKAAAGKGYLTEADALEAVNIFCKDTGLPQPTHIVSSGGGLHIYWVMDGVADREMWRAYAAKLKALTKACTFLADDSRTSDIVSVLRLPSSLNFKYDPPRPVSLLHASDTYIGRELMLEEIDGAHARLCSVPASRPPIHPAKIAHTTDKAAQQKYGPPDLAKLASALATLDPDCDDATWKLRRLAPLALEARNHPDFSAELYALAKSWSSGELRGTASIAWTTPGISNGLTGEEVFDGVWLRFLNNEYHEVPITLGSIYYDAKAAGWDYCIDTADQFEIIPADAGEIS